MLIGNDYFPPLCLKWLPLPIYEYPYLISNQVISCGAGPQFEASTPDVLVLISSQCFRFSFLFRSILARIIIMK